MVSSIDGKVTGDFLFRPECAEATEIYYKINRETVSNGFICGRVTMEQSFTGGHRPNLSPYGDRPYPAGKRADFVPADLSGFYAVAFDPKGRLGWTSDRIIDPDGDPGYDGAQIIEVLSEEADGRYTDYLKKLNIPYIFAGERTIDPLLALGKLKSLFGCQTLLLEGGSIINGAFLRADAVDELSLVLTFAVAGKESKPLFTDGNIADFELICAKKEKGGLLLRYKRVR